MSLSCESKYYYGEKSAPENRFPTNISTLHKCNTIKENSKQSTNESTRNDRFTDYIIPSDDPT